jgi:hypothetical protein
MQRIPCFSIIIILAITFASCKNDMMQTKISGKPGDLIVVVPGETWGGQVGEAMKEVLMQPQIGLPQKEPIFSVIDVPHNAFKDAFKSNRNIIYTRISPTLDSSRIELKSDVWAWSQAVVSIFARSTEEFIDLFSNNSEKIVEYILKSERDRLQINNAKFSEKRIVSLLKNKFGIEIDIPFGYKVAKETDNLIWVRYDTPEIVQSIVTYAFPYESDSTFTRDYLLNVRDSVMRAVDTPDNSYMFTEKLLAPAFQTFRFNDNYAVEIRGLWKLENEFMGGPFISLTVHDEINNRVIAVDGFVYAPTRDKRNFLRQVEAIAYSLRLPK